MKAVNLTRVRVFIFVICLVAAGFTSSAVAMPVPVDGFTSPDLPPVHPNPNVAYRSEEGVIYYPFVGISLSDITHGSFTNISRSYIGGDEIEYFDSVVTAAVDISGIGNFPAVLAGPVTAQVYSKTSGQTGTFQTEIISMTMSGNVGGVNVMVRESPTLSSSGQTSIEMSSSGWYIGSFFDVYTELSIDGGQTWVPSEESCRMVLVPEPATICLLVFGGLGILARKRR
ncbi:MAG: PEP-CTERM sorting domain-containing protein [Phycisphaerae bacterium]|nr:PEP-CTERM sorting domain-containing protein [Phycisphaerae bacterium]MDD5381924.1 PEP-CTERM sorting domain-containing protein [Phycisphaerae bacterium]